MNKVLFFLILHLFFLSCSNKEENKNDFRPILTDLNQEEFKIEDHVGNVIILNLWATWCKPCIAEFESLEKSKEKLKDKNVKIFAVSNEKLDKIKTFIDNRKFDLNFIKLNGDLSYFNAYSLPTTIILDKDGNESFRIVSGMDFTSKNFIDKILDLEKL